MKRRYKTIIVGAFIIAFLTVVLLAFYFTWSVKTLPIENDTPPEMMPDYPVKIMVCEQSDLDFGDLAYPDKVVS